MSGKDHLLGLSGVGDDKPHPAITQTHVGYLYRLCDTTQDHRLVRPIELESLTGFEVQRDEGILRMTMLLLPETGIPAYGIIATAVAVVAQ